MTRESEAVTRRLDDEHYPAYSMGRAAEMIGATPGFLRSLDEAKLLEPQRSGGGHRRYSRYELRLAARVRDLTVIEPAIEDVVARIGEQLFHLLDNVGYRRFVLDFTPVLVVSTSMLAKLIAFHKRVKASGGGLVLCNLAPEIRYVFEWMRLTQVFSIRPGEQEALEAVGPASLSLAPVSAC